MDGHRSYFPGGFSTSSFWGKCLGVGLKAPQNSRKNNTNILTSPLKKKQRHLQNTTNRCWNQNLKCWNGPSKKKCKKKLPLEGLKLVFFFLFSLRGRGRCISIHSPRLPRPGTCMFPMRQRKEWPHLRVENLRKSIKQAKDRASNQPNFDSKQKYHVKQETVTEYLNFYQWILGGFWDPQFESVNTVYPPHRLWNCPICHPKTPFDFSMIFRRS